MATATAKKVNYSAEDVTALKAMYAEKGNDGLEEIASTLGKAVRSVRAKLVREGLYVTPEKPVVAKKEGPSKKEMIAELSALVSFPVDGLMGATKESIANLIVAFAPRSDS